MAISCDTVSIVTPAARASLIISSTMDFERASRLAVGSSSRRKRGQAIKARARFKRCCSPPLKVIGLACQRLSSIPSRRSHRLASARASERSKPSRTRGSAVTSRADTRGNMWRNCEQKANSCSRNSLTVFSLAAAISTRPNRCEAYQISPLVVK